MLLRNRRRLSEKLWQRPVSTEESEQNEYLEEIEDIFVLFLLKHENVVKHDNQRGRKCHILVFDGHWKSFMMEETKDHSVVVVLYIPLPAWKSVNINSDCNTSNNFFVIAHI